MLKGSGVLESNLFCPRALCFVLTPFPGDGYSPLRLPLDKTSPLIERTVSSMNPVQLLLERQLLPKRLGF